MHGGRQIFHSNNNDSIGFRTQESRKLHANVFLAPSALGKFGKPHPNSFEPLVAGASATNVW